MNLKGNTILITGGSSGIGYELSKQLLALGNTVIITGRNEQKLTKAKAELPGLHVVASDASEAKYIEALAKKILAEFPKLNFIVNNAGIMRHLDFHGAIENLTEEIDINLKGPIRMVQAFLPHLKKQASAAIVNVSSGLAFTPLPTSPVYCATKAGLHSFTLSLRVQLAGSSVKVFELAPPATATELLGPMDQEALKGIQVMSVEDMVKDAVQGFAKDRFEIRPGQSNQLKFMSRLAPNFILNQMSRGVKRPPDATH